jgi:hypothetical protein
MVYGHRSALGIVDNGALTEIEVLKRAGSDAALSIHEFRTESEAEDGTAHHLKG